MKILNYRNEIKKGFPLRGILLAIGIFLVVFINFQADHPPAIVPATAPDSVFSAERAAQHLPNIASKPHPIGSLAHEEVRDYIMDQVESLGYNAELFVSEFYGSQRAATLENILVRVEGTGDGQAILVMGHYDTVFPAPGASDNGSAVVTLLEVLRTLRHDQVPKNDLIFLFSDGEEYGLLGARAFAEQHPWVDDIAMVINLDAMGTGGKSQLFETGNNNRIIIREFAGSAPFPAGSSFAIEVYNYMPNATDFEVFKMQGIQGLNFAYVGNTIDYHSASDNIENTDLRSIQHHGSNTAALVKHFVNSDLNHEDEQHAVYFNTIGNRFVHYPFSWVPFITVAVFMLSALFITLGIIRRKIKALSLLISLVSYLFLLVLLYGISEGMLQVIASGYPGFSFGLVTYHQQYIVLGISLIMAAFSVVYFRYIIHGVRIWQPLSLFILVVLLLWWSGGVTVIRVGLVLLISAWLYVAHRKPVDMINLSAGSMFAWTILMVISAFTVPGASYLFTWPLLFSLIPLMYISYFKSGNKDGLFIVLLLLVCAMPVLLWFPVLMNQFQLAMGIRVTAIIMLLAGLTMGLLVPHAYLMTKKQPWLIPGLIFVTGLAVLLANTLKLGYDQRHRKQNAIAYVYDESEKTSYWYTNDIFPDEWTEQFVTGKPDTLSLDRIFPPFEGRVLTKVTENTGLLPATLQILSDSIIDGERRVEFIVLPQCHSSEWQFFFGAVNDSLGLQVSDLAKQPMERYARKDWYRFLYLAPPEEGVRLTVFSRAGQIINLQLNEIDYESLPWPADYRQRPANMMNGGDRRILISHYEL